MKKRVPIDLEEEYREKLEFICIHRRKSTGENYYRVDAIKAGIDREYEECQKELKKEKK